MKKATARLSSRSTSIDFDAKYGSGYCIPLWLRDQQVKLAIKKVKGRVPHCEDKNPEPVAIVGYGPSLKDTWQEIKNFKVIITTSGAHKFLIDRGIIPTYHVDVDPRAHKVALLGDIRQDVTYMPCSTCHPNYFDTLIAAKAKIQLWHCFSTEQEAIRVLPAGEFALTGGCDAGMRAMSVARFMGYTNHHIFGMDGCAFDDQGHAAEHTNKMKKFFDLEYPKGSGKVYRTSPHLMEVAKTVPHEADMLKLDNVKVYGNGLVAAIMADYKPKRMKNSNIAFVKPELFTDAHIKAEAEKHLQSAEYGAGGHKYAENVMKLVKATGAVSVLDYGCGKGTLALSLPFPIWEYDPAIDGRQESPRQADLVVCTNVLECVEPSHLDYVLQDLARCIGKVGYLMMGGESVDYWRKRLSRYFYVGKVEEKPGGIQAVIGPKLAKKEKIKKQQNTEIVKPTVRPIVKPENYTHEIPFFENFPVWQYNVNSNFLQ